MDSELNEVFKRTAENTGITTHRFYNAHEAIKRYPISGLREEFRESSPWLYALQILHLGEAILAAESIGAPRPLIKKLTRSDPTSGEAEAHVIRRLRQSSSREIKYEPSTWGRRPDVVQFLEHGKVAYEVMKVQLAEFEKEMWHKRQTEISNRAGKIVGIGSLDIYLFVEKVSEACICTIEAGLPSILGDQERAVEHEVEGVAYAVYDPSGSVQAAGFQTSFPKFEEPSTVSGLIHDNFHDRSAGYIERLKLGHTTKIAMITAARSSSGAGGAKIVRVFRPSSDERISQKIIDETEQLPDEMPGIVVVEMGASSARLEEWMQLLGNMFDSGIYKKPSAVWLRQLTWGLTQYGWQEAIVLNGYATVSLTESFAKALLIDADKAASTYVQGHPQS